jgi:hypothetical protein
MPARVLKIGLLPYAWLFFALAHRQILYHFK